MGGLSSRVWGKQQMQQTDARALVAVLVAIMSVHQRTKDSGSNQHGSEARIRCGTGPFGRAFPSLPRPHYAQAVTEPCSKPKRHSSSFPFFHENPAPLTCFPSTPLLHAAKDLYNKLRKKKKNPKRVYIPKKPDTSRAIRPPPSSLSRKGFPYALRLERKQRL
ncbi:uncharacterized protein LY79DRAFT_368694 [Colletotrichum navitas]|uniref:Uncharacterized protein n=1 Tax=Colletotrichum navitas TaxID=681940 RepID=A0AAD8V017_9PEZI|nr:uncharacterized protein LY79DRAFT_368694 [Colletotrichum navitas]KAK1574287.1 hypothetical protein LY79DRAFT_368694 [Colletotrichum navitas]